MASRPSSSSMIMQSRGKKRSVASIPPDIISNIFLNLPLRSIARLRLAYKYWYLLTSDPLFLRSLSRRTTLQSATPISVILTYVTPANAPSLDMCLFDHVDNIDSIEISTSNTRLTGFKDKGMSLHIEACCDGLVCFSSYGSYCICNPLTMEWITVPRSSNNTVLCGFYFHPSTGEYRLLNYSDNVVEVFTLGKHSWREIKSSFEDNTPICSPSGSLMCVVHPMYCANPVLFNGSLHWTPHFSYQGILTFNIDSEKFRKMSVPRGMTTGTWCDEAHVFRQAHVLEMDERLSFWRYAGGWEIGIWILKDYIKEEWVRQYTISFRDQSMKRAFHYFKPLYVWKNGDVLLRLSGRNLALYNLELETFRELDLHSSTDYLNDVLYTETLVSHDSFWTEPKRRYPWQPDRFC